MDRRPLEGISVLELCQNVAGPYAGLVLAQLGARVIKVERPGSGDVTREWAPPYWGDDSVMFAVMNAGKESRELDLQEESDRQALWSLVDDVDVVLAAWRPGALERLGFGYDELARRNPRLIHCSISGFGTRGPLAASPGFDPLIQAFTGLMSLTGEEDGSPARAGTSVIDMGTGMWAVIAVMAALRTREDTGRGVRVTQSLLETGLAWLPYQISEYVATGEEPRRRGSGIGMLVPYQAFPTRDSPIMIAAGNDSLWRRLCTAIDRADLGAASDLATNPQRVKQRDRVVRELTETLTSEPASHWEKALSSAGVPHSRVQTISEAVDHPQTRHTGMLGTVAATGDIPLVTPLLPFSLDGTRLGPTGPPPKLGQHNHPTGFVEAQED